jgi:hypothetical protein
VSRLKVIETDFSFLATSFILDVHQVRYHMSARKINVTVEEL